MRYQVLLADADGTLFDFHAGERIALGSALAAFGLPMGDEIAALYSRVNLSHWKRLERGETTQARLKVERFSDFLAELSGQGVTVPDVSPAALSDRFVTELGRQHIPLRGAKAFLARVSARMPVYLVTNGIAKVQRSRFEASELRPFFADLLISEELGHFKPDPFMVLEAMRRAGVGDKRRAVLLGDSVTADIGAANNAGVDSILFTDGKPAPEGHGATYTALTLSDAAALTLAE
ncbi:MAG: HAD-IA family hydrolase [Eubacteriales bacterium]|nr:HAD-IA family hydrolase [Eubacteriales bacterium]